MKKYIPWNEKEIEKLKELLNNNIKYRDIADILHRGTKAIATKAKELGFQSELSRKIEFGNNLLKNGLKKCSVCKNIKPVENFYRRSYSQCIDCTKKSSNNQRDRYKNNPVSFINKKLGECRLRASKCYMIYELDLEFILELLEKQNGLCFYTGNKLVLKPNDINTISVDRVDSSKGYIKDNIVLCGYKINNMKNDLSMDKFIELCNIVSSKFLNDRN